MLSKALLTSHCRLSDSRWVMTPSWLSRSLRSFLYSSVYYHLFLISSASVSSIPFLSFFEPIFAWNVPLVSVIFLKRSLVFPSLFFSSISLNCSLKKVFLFLLAILCNSAFRWIYLSSFPLPFASLIFLALCQIIYTKEPKMYNGERTFSSISGTEKKIRQAHVKWWN